MFMPIETSIGALLLGQAATNLLLNNGRVLGASSIMAGSVFAPNINNVPIITGMGLSSAAASIFIPWLLPKYDGVIEIFGSSTWVISGLIVGMGTKYSNGCTSGHLLCGVALGSIRSIIASATFFATAVITATISFSRFPSPCPDVPCYTMTYPSTPHLYRLLSILGVSYLITFCTRFLPTASHPRLSQALTSLWTGVLFGLGLIITGMANPSKPLGFLLMLPDGGRRWDPSLAMLVVFACLPNFLVWRKFLKMPTPWVASGWSLPERKDIDLRLVAGSAVFGVGWGMLGVCPGAGVVTGFLGGWKGAVWVAGFLVGYRFL